MAYCALPVAGKGIRPALSVNRTVLRRGGGHEQRTKFVDEFHRPDVRLLQIILVMTKVLNVSDIDSNFGPKTRDAVKSFQQGRVLQPSHVAP